MSGLDRDDIIRMAREAGEAEGLETVIFHPVLERFAALVAAAEREACAKVCHDKAWELKERSIKETVKTQRARLASDAAGWHDAFPAIRARGNDAT
jgi:hypothetical protein